MNRLLQVFLTIRQRLAAPSPQGRPLTGEPGPRELQICVGCSLGGALLAGVLGVVLGYSFVFAGLVGFVACGVAARQGVMDAYGRPSSLRDLGLRVRQLNTGAGGSR